MAAKFKLARDWPEGRGSVKFVQFVEENNDAIVALQEGKVITYDTATMDQNQREVFRNKLRRACKEQGFDVESRYIQASNMLYFRRTSG